jgi:hypothetical protein
MRPRRFDRAERFLAGKTPREIATEDGVTVGRIHEQLSGFVWGTQRLASPGSVLPKGLYWRQKDDGGAWVEKVGNTTREQIQWALKLSEEPEPNPVCESCGRPL